MLPKVSEARRKEKKWCFREGKWADRFWKDAEVAQLSTCISEAMEGCWGGGALSGPLQVEDLGRQTWLGR